MVEILLLDTQVSKQLLFLLLRAVKFQQDRSVVYCNIVKELPMTRCKLCGCSNSTHPNSTSNYSKMSLKRIYC